MMRETMQSPPRTRTTRPDAKAIAMAGGTGDGRLTGRTVRAGHPDRWCDGHAGD